MIKRKHPMACDKCKRMMKIVSVDVIAKGVWVQTTVECSARHRWVRLRLADVGG